jgi:hypothetical protein
VSANAFNFWKKQNTHWERVVLLQQGDASAKQI